MTLKERCIVEAYTGYVMTQGDERDFFYKYIAEKMGRPVWTHELASKEGLAKIQLACKDDFVALCAQSDDGWTPCSEHMPEHYDDYLVTVIPKAGNLWSRMYIARYSDLMGICKQPFFHIGVVGKDSFEKLENVAAWQPLPEHYREDGV